MPGTGFDVVPSDCLALHLANRLPGATDLQLAFTGSVAVSPGTMKTMVENLPSGGKIRRNGKIDAVPAAYQSITVPVGNQRRRVTTIPWGDVATAFHTTGIPNISTFTSLPRAMGWAQFAFPLLATAPAQRLLKKWIELTVHGPDATHRARGRMYLWGKAARPNGSCSRRRG